MCGGRSSILHYGPLIETNYLYAPTPNGQSPSVSLNKSNTTTNSLNYCEIIFICGTFYFLSFVGMSNHKFISPTSYFVTLVILRLIWKSMNYIIFKRRIFVPLKLNDFLVDEILHFLYTTICCGRGYIRVAHGRLNHLRIRHVLM